MASLRRIVLTGGPGAGKTTVALALLSSFPDRFALVPEAATQVFRQLGKRWSQLDFPGRRDLQRRIYDLQRRQEAQFDAAYSGRTLLFDRGTIDGAAYWPDGPADYWLHMGTTLTAELARYDAALHLQTCAVLNVYDGPASNPVRHEDRPTAIACDQALLALWRQHPRFSRIEACTDMPRKLDSVRQTLRAWGLIP